MNLKATIGRKTLFFLCINAILGTGIFFLPAVGASYAGPASLVSWAVMSVVAIFIALYFSELISMFPKSGGVYEYTKQAFGEFPSFIFGWTAWIVGNITIAMLVVGSLHYIFPGQGVIFNVAFSLFFIALFNLISSRGIDMSAKLLLIFGIMTIGAVLAVALPGLFFSSLDNLHPFFVFPMSSIFIATYFIAETFFGLETIGYLTEEVKDKRDIPKALLMSTVIIAAISCLVAFVSLASARWDIFAVQEAPLTFLAGLYFGQGAAGIFSLLVFIPLIGTAASWIVSSPRLLYAMSRDNVLVPAFKKIDRRGIPRNAIIFQAFFSSLITIAALGDFMLVLSLLLPLVLFMYAGALMAVVRLRITKPKMKRGFSAPLPVAGPIFVTAFLGTLMLAWLTEVGSAINTMIFGLTFIFIGVPLYILIKLQSDSGFTEKFFDRISFIWDKAFPIWYGKPDINKVVGRLRLGNKSTVLDFGCGSGITTMELARRSRLVVGVDISEKQLENAVHKIKSMDMSNVILMKQSRLKFKKESFDAVIGVGVLEYLDRPQVSIEKMISMTKRGGRFSFLTFGKSLGTPAPYNLRDEEAIRNLFNGLNVELHVQKERKKMTEYWHIWGRKR